MFKRFQMKTNKLNAMRSIVIIALAAIIGFSMAACDTGNGSTHTHSYSTTWSSNATQHWHECGCGDKTDVANHTGNPCTVCGYETPTTTAQQLVADIKVGWNLGNALDATYNDFTASTPIPTLETAWGNPRTTKENITAIKNAGFNVIRIPVTWHKAVDSNYSIRPDWMTRVTEIVDYAVDNDMYILLNTHHDEPLFKFTDAQKTESLNAFRKIWEQIADNFKDYNVKLVFEGLNEPRTSGTPNQWSGGTAEECANLNEHYQVFVNTVRASGGNNGTRILMVNTYAASTEAEAINGLVLPTDTVADKLIVSIHAYVPYDFALNTDPTKNSWSQSNLSDTRPITDAIDRGYNAFVSKGIPVIMGEFGAMNKNNESVRAQWAQYYVNYAWSKGIKCVWWDNGVTEAANEGAELFGLLNRNNNNIIYPILLKGMIDGTEKPGNGGDETTTIVLARNTGEGYDNWQGFYNIPSSIIGDEITTGDTYTFTYSFKSNVAITGSLNIALIDNSATATPQYWKELSDYKTVRIGISANTEVAGTITINATGTASATTAEANRLMFQVNPASNAASEPTLTFTSFSFVKN